MSQDLATHTIILVPLFLSLDNHHHYIIMWTATLFLQIALLMQDFSQCQQDTKKALELAESEDANPNILLQKYMCGELVKRILCWQIFLNVNIYHVSDIGI